MMTMRHCYVDYSCHLLSHHHRCTLFLDFLFFFLSLDESNFVAVSMLLMVGAIVVELEVVVVVVEEATVAVVVDVVVGCLHYKNVSK